MLGIHPFSLTVDIIYKNGSSIRQTYALDWNTMKKRSFEQHMTDIMETLAVAEEPGTLDCINIISLVFDESHNILPDDIKQIREFIKDTKIECNIKNETNYQR